MRSCYQVGRWGRVNSRRFQHLRTRRVFLVLHAPHTPKTRATHAKDTGAPVDFHIHSFRPSSEIARIRDINLSELRSDGPLCRGRQVSCSQEWSPRTSEKVCRSFSIHAGCARPMPNQAWLDRCRSRHGVSKPQSSYSMIKPSYWNHNCVKTTFARAGENAWYIADVRVTIDKFCIVGHVHPEHLVMPTRIQWSYMRM